MIKLVRNIPYTVACYRNGDYRTTLMSDGTKTHEWDAENPKACYAESVDLTITKKCTNCCRFCYMDARPEGANAKMEDVREFLRSMRRGTEIAIGGGDPMEHPQLDDILEFASGIGLVPGITVHMNQLKKHHYRLVTLQRKGFLHGIGVSLPYCDMDALDLMKGCNGLRNCVAHVIAGITHHDEIGRILLNHGAVLVLGYKARGRAGEMTDEIRDEIISARNVVIASRDLPNHGTIAFDNLAIEQLKVRDWMPEDEFNTGYMGDDGEFSMYVDLVDMTYARNSMTEKVHAISVNNADAMFNNLKGDGNV